MPTGDEYVVLVDKDGFDLLDPNGHCRTMPKLQAHVAGKLHRAISVFVFSSGNALLLQRRSAGKYHSAGLWSNTCCSHPRPSESPAAAARRRLQEEMRLDCPLQELLTFTYSSPVGNGLIENEFDHVFTGCTDNEPQPDPEEADDWMWQDVNALRNDLQLHPDRYTYWLRYCFPRVLQALPKTSKVKS
jgi:isopentenyl-diphosphate delta-isomerase